MRPCSECGTDANLHYPDPVRSNPWRCVRCGTWNQDPEQAKETAKAAKAEAKAAEKEAEKAAGAAKRSDAEPVTA